MDYKLKNVVNAIEEDNKLKPKKILYRIYDELKEHKGKENAISASKLALKYFPLDTDSLRTIRTVIHEIRRSEVFDNVIGSCNKGYYWATEAEAKEANSRLFAQAFSLLKTAYTNEKKAGKNGQMLIKLTPYQREAVESLCAND